jgi:hypothetical protein
MHDASPPAWEDVKQTVGRLPSELRKRGWLQHELDRLGVLSGAASIKVTSTGDAGPQELHRRVLPRSEY